MRKIRHRHKRKTEVKKGQMLIPRELLGLLLFFLLAGSLLLAIRFAVHEFTHKRQFPLSHAEWKIYSPGQTRLSLKLPGEPQAANSNAPDADPAVLHVDRYQVAIGEFRVSLWEVSYRDGTPADLRQAAHRVSAALRESGEVAEYKENLAPTKRYGRDGLLVSGVFKRGGEQRQFRALLMGERDRLWQVVAAYPPSYRRASSASQRIIDSVRLN